MPGVLSLSLKYETFSLLQGNVLFHPFFMEISQKNICHFKLSLKKTIYLSVKFVQLN
jgi:hypothetical protein